VSNATTVLLVRHGETDWNREGRLQGWAPTGLNDRGHEQARRVGAHLADEYDIDSIVASDLCRTRETTAGIKNSDIDAEVTFDSAWRERGLGVYQGFTRAELIDRFPAFALRNGAVSLEERPEGGESYADMYDRIEQAWTDLLDGADGETVLVVTHGGPITIVLAVLNGEDILTAVQRYGISNCGLTEIEPGSEVVHRQDDLLFEPVRT